MDDNSAAGRTISMMQRAQIIQRVLVDGWSPAQLAQACGIEERQIARWVAEYRRRGMASLRTEAVDERFYRRWAGQARSVLVRTFTIVWHGVVPGTCVPLTAHDDERRRR
jgi:transposase-like protein